VIVLLFPVLVILTLVFLPFLLFVAELIVLFTALLLLLRPWRIVAATLGPPPERLEWRVRGWRASEWAVAEVAQKLSAGVTAEPEHAE
jgi:hypothetical protein